MSAAEQVKVLEKRVGELELENKRLQGTVEYLTRKLFGRKTEKTSSLCGVVLFDVVTTLFVKRPCVSYVICAVLPLRSVVLSNKPSGVYE